MFLRREKLLQLTPEQQEGLYLLLVILSISDSHLAAALIYFSCESFSLHMSLPYTPFCLTFHTLSWPILEFSVTEERART